MEPDSPAPAGPTPPDPRLPRRPPRVVPVKPIERPRSPLWMRFLPFAVAFLVGAGLFALYLRYGSFHVTWSEFTSAEGRFRVSFPGSLDGLEDVSRTEQTDAGPIVIRCFFRDTGYLTSAGVFYAVTYYDVPRSIVDLLSGEWLIEASVGDCLAGGKDVKVLSSRTLKLGPHEGREAKVSVRVSFYQCLGTVRVYLAGTRIYRLVQFQLARVESLDPAPFFDSFTILEP